MSTRRGTLPSLADGKVTKLVDASALGALYATYLLAWQGDRILATGTKCPMWIDARSGSVVPDSLLCRNVPTGSDIDDEWYFSAHNGLNLEVASRRTGVAMPVIDSTGVPAGIPPRPLYGVGARLIPPDFVAYFAAGLASELSVFRFDPRSRRVVAPPRRVISGVRAEDFTGFRQLAYADGGLLVWYEGDPGYLGQFVWTDTTGRRLSKVTMNRTNVGSFTVSPDGRHLAFSTLESPLSTSLRVLDIARGVTDSIAAGENLQPVDWGAGGKILIALRAGSRERMVEVHLDESPIRIATPAVPYTNESLDGRTRCNTYYSNVEVWKTAEPKQRIAMDGGASLWCRLSPDGRFVAWYHAAALWVAPTTGDGARRKVQIAGGGDEPRWSRDGRKIYYRQANRWFVVDAPGDAMKPGAPRLLFTGRYLQATSSWDMAPDGRVLLLEGPPSLPARQLKVLTNFPAYLQKQFGIKE